MSMHRTILTMLIAIAIAVAPMGAAQTAVRALPLAAQAVDDPDPGRSDHAEHAAEATSTAGMDMSDCHKMAKKPGKTGCPCCETNSTCSPDLCLFKCVKMLGASEVPVGPVLLASLRLWPAPPERPPDWLDGPQPPPPRA